MLHKFTLACLLSAVFVAPVAMADDDYDDDDRHRRTQVQNKGNYISAQKAGQIARSQVKNSRIKSIDFDHDGRYGAVYEVELYAGHSEYDVKVNAKTGKVIYIKRDH